ncbi:hypothetical protein CTAYLR_008840 [Chrysophaeum taylorii]|uniref:WW domain-containing protein n=1 Tax=Chrysophaeum taylorii TaxID=2483200 RepID=A0AAD7U7M7_9STRA|nr:hypothetical protein CTAYLR_008840 [Chrysophaeum taylorii]
MIVAEYTSSSEDEAPDTDDGQDTAYPNTDAQFADEQYPDTDAQYADAQYPDTDAQYPGAQYPDTDAQYPGAQYPDAQFSPPPPPLTDEKEAGWREYLEPASGCTYFHNAFSGISVWDAPDKFIPLERPNGCVVDPASGCWYFYDHSTGRSDWHRDISLSERR